MTIELAVVGKTGQAFVDTGLDLYIKRIKRYVNFSLNEIKTAKFSTKTPVQEIKEKEGLQILSRVDDNDNYVILLDENGKQMNSVKFASFILKRMQSGKKKIVFVVGGAYGFSAAVKKRADFTLSLSEMTFSHQIIRVIFAEQLYRAFTIINKEPYHNQ
jgi:23S rRNA (pseudouridine1915-N3)-methyltransferase